GKALRESQEGSERIRHIVQDLREFSHRDTGELLLADINQALDSTASIVWTMMKHSVVLDKEYRDIPQVRCYPMQIKQVFMNLLVNAYQAIERLLNFFPAERHAQIYLQLSLNLRAIISQRLVPSLDGKRVAGLEILMDTPRIKDLIKKGQIDSIREAMEQGVQEGCQTFDTVMFELYKDKKISLEQALLNADSANNVRLKIKLSSMERQAQGSARGEGEAAGSYQIRQRPS
ncbi:MAG: hypothetical protein IH803_10370, partial [Nitrospirae bacterium]|nr:hypothetical protein [Nitrospirota bacterium]